MAKKIVLVSKPNLHQTVDMDLIAQYVRHKRTALNMTLEDFAGFCGLSKQAYNNIEKGSTKIRMDTLLKVLTALNIKMTIVDSDETVDGAVND